MSAYTSEKDTRSNYERSVVLLSNTQAELNTARNVLNKAVKSLLINNSKSDKKVKKLLKKIEKSVDKSKDLDVLDSQLDELIFLTNHFGQQKQTSGKTEIYSYLKNSLDELDCSDYCASVVGDIVSKQLPNNETSHELLHLIDGIDADHIKSEKDRIDLFIKDLASSTDIKYEIKDNNTSQILQDIVVNIKEYINSITRNDCTDIQQTETSTSEYNISPISIIKDFVNRLSLPVKHKKQQTSLVKKLNNTDDSPDSIDDLIDKSVLLVNDSVSSLQLENSDLQSFISKINNQLNEIKAYMKLTRQDKKEAISRSLDLEESVISSVSYIEDKVSSANDVNDLKKDISVQLQDIRNKVEECKLPEKEKEAISAESYSRIIDELNSTQEESARLKEELKESKYQLLRDPLTGLANRLAYEERVIVEDSRRKRSKTPLSLAIWDIDYFKSVNDSYGHDVGDRVLKAFADVIQTRIRKTDLFARIGGEEFVLLMPETSIDMALSLNNKLREMFGKCKFNYNDKHFTSTASVGIAEFNGTDSAESVLKRADLALYQSKNEGRNRCTISNDETVVKQ